MATLDLRNKPFGGWGGLRFLWGYYSASPGATLAAAAADGLAVAVALLNDHADVSLHQLGDVHHLRVRGERTS